MGVNKVEANGETLIDLTKDTVKPETLAEGVTAHDASGDLIVGTMTLSKTTDLTGTTWAIPIGWTAKAWYGTYEIEGDLTYTLASGTTYNVKEFTIVAIGYGTENGFRAFNGTNAVFYNDTAFTITFTGGADVTNTDLINWLYANGELQEEETDTSTSNGLGMPQIRFTNTNQTDFSPVSEENPLKLTVELVGGGALQVGDALQVCRRKNYNYNATDEFGNKIRIRQKKKLYCFAKYIVTEDDLDKRFLTVEITNTTGQQEYALNHNGRELDDRRLAQRFLRIRRPKGDMQSNDSGQTVDASFSNVIPIWWTYTNGSIRIQ